jgi:hypothetical protein
LHHIPRSYYAPLRAGPIRPGRSGFLDRVRKRPSSCIHTSPMNVKKDRLAVAVPVSLDGVLRQAATIWHGEYGAVLRTTRLHKVARSLDATIIVLVLRCPSIVRCRAASVRCRAASVRCRAASSGRRCRGVVSSGRRCWAAGVLCVGWRVRVEYTLVGDAPYHASNQHQHSGDDEQSASHPCGSVEHGACWRNCYQWADRMVGTVRGGLLFNQKRGETV